MHVPDSFTLGHLGNVGAAKCCMGALHLQGPGLGSMLTSVDITAT